jgi:hypothetical protein
VAKISPDLQEGHCKNGIIAPIKFIIDNSDNAETFTYVAQIDKKIVNYTKEIAGGTIADPTGTVMGQGKASLTVNPNPSEICSTFYIFYTVSIVFTAQSQDHEVDATVRFYGG